MRDRAKIAYNTFRDGVSPNDAIPEWENTPAWVRDAILVAYLQGTIDDKSPLYLKTLQALHEWHEAGEDPHELIMRMNEVKYALGLP